MITRILARSRQADEGLTVIETIVSLVVLALIAASAAAMFATAFGTGRTNRLRIQASELASRQIEVARDTDVLSVPDGLVYGTAAGGFSTTPVTVPLDGIPFTVKQTSEYVPANSATSSCAAPAGSRLAYKRVSVAVSWPNMGTTVPPQADTLMQLPVTGLDPTKGVLSVPVKNAAGQPVSGAKVTVTEGANTISSATTGDDGCAVIDGLAPASDYSVAAALTGDVDPTGNPAPTHSAPAVVGAALAQDSGFVIDVGAAATITVVPPSGYALPSTALDVTLTNSTPPTSTTTYSNCSNGGVSGYCSTASGTTLTVGSPNDSSATQHGLFPFTVASKVYVNDYGDSNAPAISMGLLGGSTVTATSPAGGVPLGGVQTTNNTSAAATLYAYDPSAPTPDQFLQLNASALAKGGAAKYALPYGAWCIEASKATTCPSGQTVTLKAGASTGTVSVSS